MDLFLKRDLYVTQFDTDITWYSIFTNNSNNIATPFCIDELSATNYGNKITSMAYEKGALPSTVDPTRTSYPIHGFLIFSLKFIARPTVKILTKISRDDLAKLLSQPSPSADIIFYTTEWAPEQRYIFNPSAYPKLKMVHLKFIKTNDMDLHTVFSFYNSLERLKLTDIQLLRVLISNGGGKSFSKPLTGGYGDEPDSVDTGAVEDPYYKKYQSYKKKYLEIKHAK